MTITQGAENPPLLSRDQSRLSAMSVKSSKGAHLLTLNDVMPILRTPLPDVRSAVEVNQSNSFLVGGGEHYPIQFGCPVLFPPSIVSFFQDGQLIMSESDVTDALSKYFYISVVKHRSETNADPTSEAFEIHLSRLAKMLEAMAFPQGSKVLDIGCDDIILGAALFPHHMEYCGIDTFCSEQSGFRIVGCGEFLPFASESFDVALFNTSLDHVQDYRCALEQAFRVLKPGGLLLLISLIWTEKAELYNDIIHSHHFRRVDLLNAVGSAELIYDQNYTYKDSTNRYGGYLAFRKTAPEGGLR